MAKIDSKGMVSGTAGSVVYRNYRGMNIIQGKPRKFKQAKKSIRASMEFGLSSSTAAIIRSAFQPAYIHRDGKAAARSTKVVYRSIRNSINDSVGQRDLHDGDLSGLTGMEFNIQSKLSEVFQVSHQVTRDEQGRVVVSLGAIQAKKDICPPSWILKNSSRYRIRLSLIGFNFRSEYFEYLEFRDIDLGRYDSHEAQQIVFQTQPPSDQLLLLSMTLMAYSGSSMDAGGVLLNCREFSPCALIAAFAAEEPGEFLGKALDQSLRDIPEHRRINVVLANYEGNRLLRNLKDKIKLPPTGTPGKSCKKESEPDLAGRRVSFKRPK